MMNLLFLGVAGVLFLAALYWVRGRGGHRPTGTWAMGALLASFAFAFASYAPVIQDAVESVVPDVARLISNSFTLAAATSVLVFMFQLNLDPDDARRRIRLRLAFLALAVVGMTSLFFAEQMTHRSPKIYAAYVLIYITYLGVTVKDFLQQTWKQSKSSRRKSQRIGLRITAAGCLFALVYTAYKVFVLVSVGLGLDLIPDHSQCSTLITPARCAFSVTAPALAVLLITVGLTLPAVVWPFSQFLRRRWESESFKALGPLWDDMSNVAPEIVLAPADFGKDENEDDSDFLLHRRVIEINDGVLALRPYRSLVVHAAAEQTVSAGDQAGTPEGAAIVEAAVLRAAVRSKKAGWAANEEQAPPAPGTASRAGNLRAETEWLLLVARAYSHSDIVRAAANELAPSEAR